MRFLFHRPEKSQEYVSTAPPVAEPTIAAPVAAVTAPRSQTAKKERSQKTVTPAERLLRKRRIALATIVVSLAFGGRWYAANVEPTYPVGEGVYAATAAPKWGHMTQPNAATFYIAAADAFNLETIFDNKLSDNRNGHNIVDEPVAVLKPYVKRAQPAFALLRQGMRYPYVADYQTNYFKSNPVTATGISRPVSNFIIQREMTRLLAADAKVRASEGNHAGAIESSLDAVRLGVDTAQGHSLIDGMIGVLEQSIGTKEGIRHVSHLSAPEARAATRRLETILTTVPTMAQIMTRERDMIYETIQDVYRQSSLGETAEFGSTDAQEFLKGVGGRIMYNAGLMYYTKQGLVNDYARYTDQVLARVKLPYGEARLLPPVAESANPLVRMASVSGEPAFQKYTQVAAWNRVLLTQLAVQAYRGEHGGIAPPSLTALASGTNPYLQAVPTDPFSSTGTDALRYNARTGTAYSVGENGLDDGNAGDDNAELFKP